MFSQVENTNTNNNNNNKKKKRQFSFHVQGSIRLLCKYMYFCRKRFIGRDNYFPFL